MAARGEQPPSELVRDNAMRLVQSEETRKLIEQLRGQLVQAASTAIDARVNSFAQRLTDKTEALKAPSGAVDTASDTVSDAPDKVKGLTRKPQQVTNLLGSDGKEDETQDDDQSTGSDASVEDEAEQSKDEEPEDRDEDDERDQLERRVDELMGERLPSLRKMAVELRFEKDDIVDLDKRELAQAIARAEAEDAAEGSPEPSQEQSVSSDKEAS
jgi:hypothetical protein